MRVAAVQERLAGRREAARGPWPDPERRTPAVAGRDRITRWKTAVIRPPGGVGLLAPDRKSRPDMPFGPVRAPGDS